MKKKRLRELVTSLISSDKTTEEKEIITNEVMRHIGSSNLNTKIIHYDDKGNLGVFYYTNDKSFFKKEIKDYLDKISKRKSTASSQGKLETKVKRGRPPKTSKEYEEDPSPPPNQLSVKESCKYLEEEYNIKISQRDLKKIMQEMPLTRESLKDAHRFKMFKIVPIDLTESKFHKFKVTINNKIGIPGYFCERNSILYNLLNEDTENTDDTDFFTL
jgi:hypothetical protein